MEHGSKKKKTFFSRCPQWSGIAWIQFTSILTLVLIFVWIMDSDFLGTWSGIAISFSPSNPLQNWKTFNWHPLLMVLGLVFHSNAITSFKVIPDRYSRMYHIVLHIISIFCITFSFYIAWTFVSIQEISKVKNGHLSTIHAWIGFMTFICYLLQLTVGYLVFVIFQYFQNKFPFLSEVKSWLYSKHKYFGVVCWLFAILSLVTGIMERQEIYHYLQLREPLSPTAYMYANALVLSFLAMFGCVMYILFYTKQDQLHEENSYDPVGSVI